MPERKIELQWPMAGVDERHAVQRQPPFTTPDAQNVRPDESIAQRAMGGSRPGLGRPFTEVSADSPVRMLAQVRAIQATPAVSWSDDFDNTPLGAVWEWSGNAGSDEGFPSVGGPFGGYAYAPENEQYRALRDGPTDFDATVTYDTYLVIDYTVGIGATFELYTRTDGTGGNAGEPYEDGVVLSIVVTAGAGAYTGTLQRYSSGSSTSSDALTTGSLVSGTNTVRLRVATNNVSVTLNDIEILAATTIGATAGTAFGFGITQSIPAEGGSFFSRARVNSITMTYRESTPEQDEQLRHYVVNAKAGIPYLADEVDTTFATLTTSLDLNPDIHIQAADHLQDLYIADYGKVFAATNGTTDADPGLTFASATYSDWTDISGEAVSTSFVLIITSGTNVAAGTYQIASVAAGAITLATTPGFSGSAIVFRVERAAKTIDPTLGEMNKWTATAGTVPAGCPLICRYNDRIVLAGEPRNPHLWYASRQGNPLDWDFGVDPFDIGKAYSGTALQQSGATELGEPITALIPTDDVLIFGCTSSVWAMIGDPAQGGAIINRSLRVGVVGRNAWCHAPGGEVFFLSHDGLYMMQTPTAYPVPVSRGRLPDQLRDIDESNRTITMAYDIRDRGIHIYLTGEDTLATTHWWFAWETQSFWRVTLDSTHEPFSIMSYDPSVATGIRVLLGCRDGNIRSYEHGQATDNGTAFTSYCFIGPIRPAGAERTGMIRELVGTLPQGSQDVTWSVHPGQTAAEAFVAAATESGTWSTGLNSRTRPRRRADFAYIKLTGTTAPWALEEATATLEALGVQRVA